MGDARVREIELEDRDARLASVLVAAALAVAPPAERKLVRRDVTAHAPATLLIHHRETVAPRVDPELLVDAAARALARAITLVHLAAGLVGCHRAAERHERAVAWVHVRRDRRERELLRAV